MDKFAAEKYMTICQNLSLMAAQSHDISIDWDDEGKRATSKAIKRIQKECDDIGLKTASRQIQEVLANIRVGAITTPRQLSQILLNMSSAIRAEISTHFFMQISPKRVDFYEQEELFGPEVDLNFPSAKRDIKSAGSCYACDRNTACVMHLMRVLEVGLNTLAATLKVPFDRRNWENIINDIDVEIKKINGPHAGADWKNKQQFYAGAAKDFRHFKDAWRNHAMHYREHYDATEALTTLNHVKEFMTHLADGHLSE
jgi:hypothetical protein